MPEESLLIVQANLATSYAQVGHLEKALSMERDVYFGCLKLQGEEDERTLQTANNYAHSLCGLKRFKEAGSLMRKMMPVARRVLGEGHRVTLKMRWTYAGAICRDPDATLVDLREAVATLEEAAPIARRVLGGAHPNTQGIEDELLDAREALRAREGTA